MRFRIPWTEPLLDHSHASSASEADELKDGRSSNSYRNSFFWLELRFDRVPDHESNVRLAATMIGSTTRDESFTIPFDFVRKTPTRGRRCEDGERDEACRCDSCERVGESIRRSSRAARPAAAVTDSWTPLRNPRRTTIVEADFPGRFRRSLDSAS